MSKIYADNSQSIGNTPLIKLNHITEGAKATVLAKIEARNPAYSVKCRIGASMVRDAEVRGVLRPGDAVFVGPVVLVLERRVRAYQLPAEVTPECLLDGITALAGPEQGIAVIRLDLGEELDAGWLRAAVSGLAVPLMRTR